MVGAHGHRPRCRRWGIGDSHRPALAAKEVETVITDLLDGQYNSPVRVVGFNTAEGWSRDVSEDIVHEVRRRCDLQMTDPPVCLEGFLEEHERGDQRQLTLRLV